jgi:hypothetical protein
MNGANHPPWSKGSDKSTDGATDYRNPHLLKIITMETRKAKQAY